MKQVNATFKINLINLQLFQETEQNKKVFSGYATHASSLHINLIYDYVKIFSVMFILLLLNNKQNLLFTFFAIRNI